MNGPATGIMNTPAVAMLALGTLVLGGCATSHVGNTWQCPLIEGQPCQSVRDADPAAPVLSDPGISDSVASGLFRSDTAGARSAQAKCRGGCRPFGWLRRAFATGGEDRTDTGVDSVATDDGQNAQTGTASGGEEPQPAGLQPAGLQPAGPWRDGARTPEVLGRIWIGPYVDTAGVYHEGSWVRVVFEPAGWRTEP